MAILGTNLWRTSSRPGRPSQFPPLCLKVAPTAWAVQSHQTTANTSPAPTDIGLLPGVGHNVPQEAPEAFAEAVTTLLP